jgi:preprotein translocase subunit SecB
MADELPGGAAPQAGQANQGATLNIVGQYIKDLSFENPRAPQSILVGTGQPKFNVSINVGFNKQDGDVYSVELSFTAKAERDSGVLFNVELVYGGLFRVKGFAENQLALILMVECPRLLFPFARQVLASTTQAGGFPPLLMDPVDFFQIYRQNMERLQAQQNAGAAAPAANAPEIVLDKKPN